MDGNTNAARRAAEQMVENEQALRRELISEGVYHVVVEGGYHTEALDDTEADYLAELIVDHGVTGLREYASET